MEDILIAIAAAILHICLVVLWAARRPWKFLISEEYRLKLNGEWSGRSRVFFYSHVFGGFVLLAASIVIVFYALYFFGFRPEPDPTAAEQLRDRLTDIVIKAVKEVK